MSFDLAVGCKPTKEIFTRRDQSKALLNIELGLVTYQPYLP